MRRSWTSRVSRREPEVDPMIATRRSAVRLAAAALALISIAAPAWSAPPKWDPKQVLALAERLAKALDEVEAAAREAPPQATALQQRKRDEIGRASRKERA